MRRRRVCISIFASVFGLSLLAASAVRAAEPDLRPELDPRGELAAWALTPAGDLWLGTRAGYAYVSRDGNRSWEEADVSERRIGPERFLGDHLTEVRFFDERRGFFAGWVGENQDVIWRTSDGGKTWVKSRLPLKTFWVYDAQVTADGIAWLVGSSGDLIYSEDYGKSWRLLARPFESQSMRSHTVHFVGEGLGVVGALSDGLVLTRDGGESWQPIPTPVARGKVDAERCSPDARVNKVRILGDRLLITQCGKTFVGALDFRRPAWREVTAAGQPIIQFALYGERVVVVTADLAVYLLDRKTLTEAEPMDLTLHSYPESIAVTGDQIAILEAEGRVTIGRPGELRTSRMFGKGIATSWPIVDFDRDRAGELWGISSFFLYRSYDGGRTWVRLAELDTAHVGMAVQGSGGVLIWDRHGSVVRWDPEEGALSPVPGLDGLDLVGLFRRGGLWLAYGGMQYETMARVEIARSFFAGQFAGSVPYGFVAASSDGGATWRVIDRWEEGGIQKIFLADDGRLVALSWLGTVRRGQLETDPAGEVSVEMTTILPATEETRGAVPYGAVPYVEEVLYLDFLKKGRGWIYGWTHHLGDFLFRSDDSGKSWRQARCGPCFEGPYRLGSGRWVALEPPRTVRRWDGRRFRVFRELPSDVISLRVDSTGALLVELADGSIQMLSRGAREWETLREAAADREASSRPRQVGDEDETVQCFGPSLIGGSAKLILYRAYAPGRDVGQPQDADRRMVHTGRAMPVDRVLFHVGDGPRLVRRAPTTPSTSARCASCASARRATTGR